MTKSCNYINTMLQKNAPARLISRMEGRHVRIIYELKIFWIVEISRVIAQSGGITHIMR